MPRRLSPLKIQTLPRKLGKLGVQVIPDRGKGSHVMLLKPEKPGSKKGPQRPVKNHGKNTEFSVGAITRILRLLEIEKSDFLDASAVRKPSCGFGREKHPPLSGRDESERQEDNGKTAASPVSRGHDKTAPVSSPKATAKKYFTARTEKRRRAGFQASRFESSHPSNSGGSSPIIFSQLMSKISHVSSSR